MWTIHSFNYEIIFICIAIVALLAFMLYAAIYK